VITPTPFVGTDNMQTQIIGGNSACGELLICQMTGAELSVIARRCLGIANFLEK